MPRLIIRGNEGNGGGIDTKVHVGMISPPEAEEEGWIHGLWKLGYLGSKDAPWSSDQCGKVDWMAGQGVGVPSGESKACITKIRGHL